MTLPKKAGIPKNHKEQVKNGFGNNDKDNLDKKLKPNEASPELEEILQLKLDDAKERIEAEEYDEAIDYYRNYFHENKTLQRMPVEGIYHKAAAAAIKGDYPLAVELHCKLLAVEPKHHQGLSNFAVVMRRKRSLKWAEIFIGRSLEIAPNSTEGLNTKGTILNDLGLTEQALEAYKAGLAINPNSQTLQNNIANAYHIQANIDLAYIYSTKAVSTGKADNTIWLDHLIHVMRSCDIERQQKINWWYILEHSNAEKVSTSFLQYLVISESIEENLRLKKEAMRWGRSQSAQVDKIRSKSPMPVPAEGAGPMKIGFVSADFKDHSVARFIWPLFELLDKSKYELYGYSTDKKVDQWRERFDANATVMRDVERMSPRELNELILSDGVHVLFDLTGFTKGSRTYCFAWRSAAVQVSWLGYPGTSGLENMDYIFVDKYLKPSDPELTCEQHLVTDGSTVCFSGLNDIPITQRLPEDIRGFITIGSLNNPYKLNQGTIRRWAKVMALLPTARLLLVRREYESYYLRINITKEFAKYGIDKQRIHFYNNRKKNRHYLDCYNEIDLSLDTFPVTGGTTTVDALWMGVPVVTLEGSNIHQRVCSSILNHAGLPDLIAHNEEEFVEISIRVAEDRSLRKRLRETLRKRISNSPLCDTKKFVNDFSCAMDQLRGRALL